MEPWILALGVALAYLWTEITQQSVDWLCKQHFKIANIYLTALFTFCIVPMPPLCSRSEYVKVVLLQHSFFMWYCLYLFLLLLFCFISYLCYCQTTSMDQGIWNYCHGNPQICPLYGGAQSHSAIRQMKRQPICVSLSYRQSCQPKGWGFAS